jgi:ABC-type glycerol-3-phosphate transport system substrate-binding protein
MQLPYFLQNRRNQIIVGVVTFILITMMAVILWPRSATPLPVDTTPVSLTWWKPFYGNETYSDTINDFKKIYPNVNIQIVTQQYNTEYYQNLIADIAKNAGPDIFTLRNDDLPAYKEYMTPIRQFQGAQLAKYKTDFADLVVRETMDRDKVFAITSYVDNLALYYNKTILAQSGVAIVPSTWAELDGQLNKINKRSATDLNFTQSAISLGTGGRSADGIPNINRLQDILPMLIFQQGGQLFDYQQNRSVFGNNKNSSDVNSGLSTGQNFNTDTSIDVNSPTYKAMKFYADFANPQSNRYSWNNASPNNVDAFVEGKLAYILHYSYFQDTIASRNSRLQYGVAPMPQLDTNFKKTYGFYFMDGINRNLETDPTKAKKREAAERFLYFLSLPEQQRKFVTKTSLPAARKDIVNEQLNGDEKLRVFAAGSLFSDNYYKPDVQATEKIWNDLFERVWYGGETLDSSLKKSIIQYNTLVISGPKLQN